MRQRGIFMTKRISGKLQVSCTRSRVYQLVVVLSNITSVSFNLGTLYITCARGRQFYFCESASFSRTNIFVPC